MSPQREQRKSSRFGSACCCPASQDGVREPNNSTRSQLHRERVRRARASTSARARVSTERRDGVLNGLSLDRPEPTVQTARVHRPCCNPSPMLNGTAVHVRRLVPPAAACQKAGALETNSPRPAAELTRSRARPVAESEPCECDQSLADRPAHPPPFIDLITWSRLHACSRGCRSRNRADSSSR